jgi:hypothetical protein
MFISNNRVRLLIIFAQEGIWCSSVDITSIIDTIPVHLIRRILENLIKSHVVNELKEFINDILSISANRSFYFKNKPFKYGTE